MKPLKTLSAILLLMIGITGCEKELILTDSSMADQTGTLKGAKIKMVEKFKATGSVELKWKGADKGADKGKKPEDLLVFFHLNAHQDYDFKDPKGELVYTVLEIDSTLHREIKASVYDVFIDPDLHKGWILATVVSDSKGCNGNDQGGHDSGCSSGDDHDSGGGCTHDDTGGDDGTTHEDGGCSHDDTSGDDGTIHEDGGCSGEDTGTDDSSSHDEGCTHDDTGGDDGTTHDDGGCSGEDTGVDHEGGMGGAPGGDDKGNPMSGKNCRIGQIIALKVHDGGTPGVNGDGITWKWFSPEGLFVPTIENIALWPHLCKKEIIGGNIVVHD